MCLWILEYGIMEQKSVKVYEKTHKRLMKLVGHNGCRSVDDVMNFLIDFLEKSQSRGSRHQEVRK